MIFNGSGRADALRVTDRSPGRGVYRRSNAVELRAPKRRKRVNAPLLWLRLWPSLPRCAVSQNCILRQSGNRSRSSFRRLCDYQTAIRQITNLRYAVALLR